MATDLTAEAQLDAVRAAYTAVARSKTDKDDATRVALAFGYSKDDLLDGDDAHMGLSCGNPVATAGIREVRHRSH